MAWIRTVKEADATGMVKEGGIRRGNFESRKSLQYRQTFQFLQVGLSGDDDKSEFASCVSRVDCVQILFRSSEPNVFGYFACVLKSDGG